MLHVTLFTVFGLLYGINLLELFSAGARAALLSPAPQVICWLFFVLLLLDFFLMTTRKPETVPIPIFIKCQHQRQKIACQP